MCGTLTFTGAPEIDPNPYIYYPIIDGTASISVVWTLDASSQKYDSCGPYTLKLSQSADDVPLDASKTTIVVVD